MAKDNNLLRRLNKLGFPLFEPEEALDANATLADVVKSKDLRLWENFPVVLANSVQLGLFDYDTLRRHLEMPSHRMHLYSLMLVSLALYEALGLKFSWADKFYQVLVARKNKEYKAVLEKLKKDGNLRMGGFMLSGQKLKANFNNYFRQEESKLNDLLSTREELGLEYALSQVFSPKQKELFLKKLKGEKLTKTEKEYFSRAVKKKALALANQELHRMARRLLEF